MVSLVQLQGVRPRHWLPEFQNFQSDSDVSHQPSSRLAEGQASIRIVNNSRETNMLPEGVASAHSVGTYLPAGVHVADRHLPYRLTRVERHTHRYLSLVS